MAEQSSSLGLLLRRLRALAGLSQERLAERAGISSRAISDLERGLHRTPHPDTLARLADALALSSDQRAELLAAAHPTLTPPDLTPHPPLPRGEGVTLPLSLPLPPTPLIGRRRERERALAMLRDATTRLLTVTGPGGVGKTHLALEIAHDLAAEFPAGVCYVELEPLYDAALVPGALIRALGLREQQDIPLAEQLSTHLREKHLLVVLDGCEHLPRAAPLVADLLARCPHLAFLATSRAPLRLRAEHTLSLAPLQLGDAVALFRQRALAVLPDVIYDDADMAAICERLDCLPLAIELAAARVRVLSLPRMCDELAHRLPLLRAGAVDLPPRQRTMEDAIGWSYDLLTGEQQRFFRVLGVFAGGCTLDAARAVCGDAEDADPAETIGALAALVDASLLQAEEQVDGTPRFRHLELMREYALARLREAGEEDARQRRHAAYFAALADEALLYGPGAQAKDAGLARELSNARTALDWALAHREPELGLRLAGFARLWHLHGDMHEALDWQERMLALDAALRAQGIPAAPLSLRARCLSGFARSLLGAGQLERAEAAAREALQVAQQAGDEEGIGNACLTLGQIAQARGDLDAAEEAFALAMSHADAATQGATRHRALTSLAEVARARGDFERAAALLAEALDGARATGNSWEAAMITTLLGHTARQRGRYAQACAHYRDALALLATAGSPPFLAWCLEGLAATLAAEGRTAQAVRLCAAAAGMRERAGTPLPPAERAEIERVLDEARVALGEPVFRAEWVAAATLPLDEVVAAALALAAEPPLTKRVRRSLARRRALGRT